MKQNDDQREAVFELRRRRTMSGDEIQEKLRDRYLRGDDFSREVLELIHSLGVEVPRSAARSRRRAGSGTAAVGEGRIKKAPLRAHTYS